MIRKSRDDHAFACMQALNPFPAEDLRGSVDEAHLAGAMRAAIAAGDAPARPIPVGDRVARDFGAGGERRHAGILSRPAWRLALTAVAVLTAVAAVAVLSGRASETAPRAYGAELVRYAESTPLLLLESPGWRVADVSETGYGPYLPKDSRGAGSMQFVTGKPIPTEAIRMVADPKTGFRVSGMLPAAVRQRKVELSWRTGDSQPPWTVRHPIRLPVLGTTALVNRHAGRMFFVDAEGKHVFEPGKPGDRRMAAFWTEDGHVLEMRADVRDLAAFAERLSWLRRVDSQTWLDAMPPNVVKAADHDAVVREMLNGIPLPGTFTPSYVPSEGLTTDRYQVGAAVTATVSCLWFRQWGEARRSHDRAAELEAERAMATSRHWPVLREMGKDGAYPETIWKLADEMPSGYREYAGHKWRLLPQAEALGCARHGIPVLPWKQRLQRERRASRSLPQR